MNRCMAWAVSALIIYGVYLLLTFWTGTVGLWSLEELIAGAVIAVLGAVPLAEVVWKRGDARLLQPHRWILFIFYLIGPFFFSMARANFDVAYRVITGRIKPGIVRFQPHLKTDFGRTLLANSITLTPGTLTVDVDDETGEFYVHWIYVRNPDPRPEEVCGPFPAWARRIAE
ncbi:Na+/H+ antiporter subunit E [Candidatus Bipolaricaulota sp. J31]